MILLTRCRTDYNLLILQVPVTMAFGLVTMAITSSTTVEVKDTRKKGIFTLYRSSH